MTFDGKILGEEVVDAAKGYIDKQMVSLLARLMTPSTGGWRSRLKFSDLAPIEGTSLGCSWRSPNCRMSRS